MRLDDMKKDIPETPEFIHTMIQNEVKKQLQDTKMIPVRTRRAKKRICVRVAAAVACVLAASTIVYAGAKMYHIFLEKQGTYGVSAGIKAEDGSEKITLPEKIHEIDISAGYIPEGMEWSDEGHLQYPEHDRTGGFSFASVLLDEGGLDKAVQDTSVVACEERTFGSYEGVYLKYNDLAEDGSFNQRIYLLCPELYRVVTVYIGDDIAKEEAVKVVENLVITENETMLETAGLYTWSELVSPEEEAGEEMLTSIGDKKLPIHGIGEAFEISAYGEDPDGNVLDAQKISVCVDNVLIEDNLQLLDGEKIPKEWAEAAGADGKIQANTLSYIKAGDGVETVDEIVETETMEQKLVYATVTYTNKTETEMKHILYLGTLMLLSHEDGIYQIWNPAEASGEDWDRVIWDGPAHTAEMTYSSVSEDYGNGKNYIPALKPGESVQVNMAWIVNENQLDKMYLNLNGEGGAIQFADSALESGVVDIRQ